MRSRRNTEPLISEAAAGELRQLITRVPDDADEHDPAFLALLDAWERCAVPWNIRPTVPAYKTRGGTFIVSNVPKVLARISAHAQSEVT